MALLIHTVGEHDEYKPDSFFIRINWFIPLKLLE